MARLWRAEGELRLPDLDVAAVRSQAAYPLTRAIGRWSYEHGLAGVRYLSRVNTQWECWAIFESTPFARVRVAVITADDPELVEAARALGLSL